MKIKFVLDSSNIGSHHIAEEQFDSCEDLGYTDEEWNRFTEDEKNEEVKIWAMNYLDWWYEEYE